MKRMGALRVALLGLVLGVRCGGPGPLAPEPGSPESGYPAVWTIEVAETSSQTRFSLRVWVNEEVAFSDTNLRVDHLGEVSQRYQPGPQSVEAEILNATASAGDFTIRVVLTNPSGESIFGERSGPMRGQVGQRLTFSFYLLPPKK
jgi:hypothetical protein